MIGNWLVVLHEGQLLADSVEKVAQISTVEKYALEIEIFTLSRGFRAHISRSGAQITHLQRSVCGQSGRTDFFNRIGRTLPVTTDSNPKRTLANALAPEGRLEQFVGANRANLALVLPWPNRQRH